MSRSHLVAEIDPFDRQRVQRASGLLRHFNEAGVLAASDVHVALRLGALTGEDDEVVVLAAALAVRGPRLSHVCIDLATVRDGIVVDVDMAVDTTALPWPDSGEWMQRVSASPMVCVGVDGQHDRPLRLVGTLLYLDRYWQEERQVAADLNARGELAAEGVDQAVLEEGLARLFPDPGPDEQRLAAATAVLRRFSVVAGGPGTGKTTTVATILALLDEQPGAGGSPHLLVALAAPTAKAAVRLQEAIHNEAAFLSVEDATRTRLLQTEALTLHRLLGWRPDSSTRFRHHRGNRLPHDVVVIDETSMVSLTMMARLVEAVRPDARLVLVGDPEQLASVEAGAVLGDIVGPAGVGLLMREPSSELLSLVTRQEVSATAPPAGTCIGDGIIVLRKVHRYGGGIADLAEAVRLGDADAAVAVLTEAQEDIAWIPVDVAEPDAAAKLGPVRSAALDAGRRVTQAARAGQAGDALKALGSFRLLCAHRRGSYGVSTWTANVETWLASGIEGFAAGGLWYVGRPLLVTENDYSLDLFNGDTGVVVARPGGRAAAVFERRGELVEVSPSRLSAVDTVYAMTIHKSQGSQFATVAVVLPDPTSPILTRELLYTAVTRTREKLILVGTEEAVRAAVTRPVARASGLRRWLWGE